MMKTRNINPAIFQALAFIAKNVYEDAQAHGLWNGKAYDLKDRRGMAYVRRCHVIPIREEVAEAYEAAVDPAHFAEELADVVIMTLSAAGHLGIDLAAEIRRKMEINEGRPYQHRTD